MFSMSRVWGPMRKVIEKIVHLCKKCDVVFLVHCRPSAEFDRRAPTAYPCALRQNRYAGKGREIGIFAISVDVGAMELKVGNKK